MRCGLLGGLLGGLLVLAATALISGAALADPLPSWKGTEAKSDIIAFVESVTDPASRDYVTTSDRIAVFDNDGTLWSEKPVYFQLLLLSTGCVSSPRAIPRF